MKRSMGRVPLAAHPLGWVALAAAWSWNPLLASAGKWVRLAELLWRMGALGFLALHTLVFGAVALLQLRRNLPGVDQSAARWALVLYTCNLPALAWIGWATLHAR